MSRMTFPLPWSMSGPADARLSRLARRPLAVSLRDAAAFLGLAGYAELTPYPDAVVSLCDACRRYGWPEERVEGFLRRLDKKGEPTAYLFRCLHCGRHLA
jgi:uncharacterized protein CbrC (UPF0167 family)